MRPPFSTTRAPEHLLWQGGPKIHLVPGKDVGLLRAGKWVSRDPQGERQPQFFEVIRSTIDPTGSLNHISCSNIRKMYQNVI